MTKHLFNVRTIFALLAISSFVLSCKKLDPEPLPKAEFTYGVDGALVSFQNASVNFNKAVWDFGDGSQSELTFNTSHLYTANKTYQVTLTVSKDNNKDVIVKNVTVTGVKGSAVFYKGFSTNSGRNIDVYVDGTYGGTINGNYYFTGNPGCGNQNSATVQNLKEGNHSFTAKETSGLLPLSWSGTVTVVGGQCTGMGLTKN